ncbi:ribosomal protein S1 [Clostridium saccharoperbutylacetonicum]|nr:ribosomal protein S1 [Clostridium saccharoperbutylacetonicum]
MLNEEVQDSMKELLKEYDVKKLNMGDILKGTVIDVNDKEASVNINYAFDGLISKEEISLDGKDPREVLSKDDEIDVYVISPNDGEGYVELSLVRALQIKEKEDIEEFYKNQKILL